MKESVLDVLMYIINNYVDEDLEFIPNQELLKKELMEAGFSDQKIEKAFTWLEGLTFKKDSIISGISPEGISLRLFSQRECEKLDTESRGFLMFLEQAGILNSHERELVIDRILELESDDIELQQLKWVVLMVLFNQPDKETVISWMESIVMDNMNTNLH